MKKGIDVLLIPPGDICLPGYDTGFIGGCCGLIDKNILAFTGSLSEYSHGHKIIKFLEDHNVQYDCLLPGKMLDIGGVIPLKCKID